MYFVFRCNYEQAIVLASYSLQAESGDHDPERHTLENLQDLPLLPKTMMAQLSEERFGKTFKTTGSLSTYTWKVNVFRREILRVRPSNMRVAPPNHPLCPGMY